MPATFTVSTTADGGTGSLRDAIAQANVSAGVADSIVFSGTVFNSAKTITLTGGQLLLTGTAATTIIGPTVGVTLSGNNATRVLRVAPGATAAVTGLTVSNGYVFGGSGGGIANLGTLTLTNSTLSGNTATYGGGLTIGSYTIAPSAATGTGLSNYAIVYVGGTLTVRPSPGMVGYPLIVVGAGDGWPAAVTVYTTDGSVDHTLDPFPGMLGGVRQQTRRPPSCVRPQRVCSWLGLPARGTARPATSGVSPFAAPTTRSASTRPASPSPVGSAGGGTLPRPSSTGSTPC